MLNRPRAYLQPDHLRLLRTEERVVAVFIAVAPVSHRRALQGRRRLAVRHGRPPAVNDMDLETCTVWICNNPTQVARWVTLAHPVQLISDDVAYPYSTHTPEHSDDRTKWVALATAFRF